MSMKGTPWEPVPNNTRLKIPTHIETNGAILNDEGDIEGYVEENQHEKQNINHRLTKKKKFNIKQVQRR